MGIEFDDSRVDVRGLDDRRGIGGGGIAIGGGAGIVGLILVVLFNLLGGQGGLPLSPGDGGTSQGESTREIEQRCNTPGAVNQYTDCRLIKVYDIADDVWRDEFARRGVPYESPRLAFFQQGVQTGCGQASSQVGPFYCPPDEEIYIDLGFLEQLQEEFGAEGAFAQAYILAHEFGHHLQTLLGTERRVRAGQQQNPDLTNQYSIALELQADCYAGVWATLADRRSENGIRLTQENIAEAVNAAQAVGDDRIQAKTQGRIDPESWTHGSAQQRRDWFLTGFQSASLDGCNTFR